MQHPLQLKRLRLSVVQVFRLFLIVDGTDATADVKPTDAVATKSEPSNPPPPISELDQQSIVPPVDLQVNQGATSSLSPRGIAFLLLSSLDVSSPIPPLAEDNAMVHGLPMSRPGSLGLQDFPSLLRNPSSFMGEGALRTPFSRNASATFQLPMGFPYFQRNSSFEGAYFPDLSQSYLSPDMTMYPPPPVLYRVR